MPQQIIVSPQPSPPDTYVTVCVVPLTSGAAYVSVSFYDADAQIISGGTYKLTPDRPCVEIRVPANADHGLCEDQLQVMLDALISTS